MLRADLLADRRERLVDARLLEVAQHDRHLEPAQEERRELRRHQAGADDADLLHAARLRVGQLGRPLRAPLDDGERVGGRLRLRAARAARPSRPPPPRSPRRSTSPARRRSGRARRTARASRRAPRRRRASASCAATVSSVRPVRRRRARRSTSSRANASDSSTNSTGSSRRSAIPSSNASGAVSSLFWRSGFSDDHLRRRLGADRAAAGAACRPRPG